MQYYSKFCKQSIPQIFTFVMKTASKILLDATNITINWLNIPVPIRLIVIYIYIYIYKSIMYMCLKSIESSRISTD